MCEVEGPAGAQRVELASQSGGREMKRLPFQSSLGGADEACRRRTRASVQTGYRGSHADEEGVNVGVCVQSGESELQCVKVQSAYLVCSGEINRRL